MPKLPWEPASWFMETRSKRRQQELEDAAIAAPVQTRAQKAANIASQSLAPALTLPSVRKRKQTTPQQIDTRSSKRRQQVRDRNAANDQAEAGNTQHPSSKRTSGPEDVTGNPTTSARIDQLEEEMDRHRREARRGLDEATREAEQVRQ